MYDSIILWAVKLAIGTPIRPTHALKDVRIDFGSGADFCYRVTNKRWNTDSTFNVSYKIIRNVSATLWMLAKTTMHENVMQKLRIHISDCLSVKIQAKIKCIIITSCQRSWGQSVAQSCPNWTYAVYRTEEILSATKQPRNIAKKHRSATRLPQVIKRRSHNNRENYVHLRANRIMTQLQPK